ncbi:Chromosome transmission fidelity protein 18 [Dispira parvispora]|uniref:Chromosome transmission fidelity protein 18 n=1 Tax=Dispira parvispora TaxID=1520584 RepID=A0A9W8E3P2_9FUNG|nr:Chromosome transmission fidelity protein 18 [Dispira parvispora]
MPAQRETSEANDPYTTVGLAGSKRPLEVGGANPSARSEIQPVLDPLQTATKKTKLGQSPTQEDFDIAEARSESDLLFDREFLLQDSLLLQKFPSSSDQTGPPAHSVSSSLNGESSASLALPPILFGTNRDTETSHDIDEDDTLLPSSSQPFHQWMDLTLPPEDSSIEGLYAQDKPWEVAKSVASGRDNSDESAGIHHASSTCIIAQQSNYFLPPPQGSFVMATASNGKRLYFPKRPSVLRQPLGQVLADARRTTNELLQSKKGLINQSMDHIMDELEQERRSTTRSEPSHSDFNQPPDGKVTSPATTANSDHAMWVDTYRPRYFTDLVSDEKVNREALLWLKQWDYCVFGRKNPVLATQRVFFRSKARYNGNSSRQDSPAKESEASAPNVASGGEGSPAVGPKDPYQRPYRRILLLAGPPGLGKTTLAHIIARQAGYTTMEINASDDRTGTQVYQKLISITQTHSVRASGKPTALIIDEVDGVVGGKDNGGSGGRDFISLLVDMANAVATPRSQSDHESSTLGGILSTGDRKRKTRTGPPPLMRPIICICNDLYAPALRNLRAVAQVYHLRPPPAAVLARRLQNICQAEAVHIDLSTLVSLSDRAEGDLRSCLHTLQFLRRQLGPQCHLKWEHMQQAPIGIKDSQRSLFQLWERIFVPPDVRSIIRKGLPVKATAPGALGNQQSRTSLARHTYLQQLMGDIEACHEYDKLLMGCFENYPRLRFHDTYFHKMVQFGDWLGFYDRLNTLVYQNHGGGSEGKGALYQYMAYPLLYSHTAFASPFARTLEFSYPRMEYEVTVRRKACEQTLDSLIGGIRSVAARSQWTATRTAQDLMPWLVRILATPITAANAQLLKHEEKLGLSRLVEVMASFGITYQQERDEHGQFQYHLQPPLETTLVSDRPHATIWVELLKPGGPNHAKSASLDSAVRRTTLLPIKYATRQLIAQEVEKENIRRREQLLQDKAPLPATKSSTRALPPTSTEKKSELQSTPASTIPRPIPPPPPPTRAVAKDFFGRPIPSATDSITQTLGSSTPVASPALPRTSTTNSPSMQEKPHGVIWYQYNEGFSNAVRRPVKMSEFMM